MSKLIVIRDLARLATRIENDQFGLLALDITQTNYLKRGICQSDLAGMNNVYWCNQFDPSVASKVKYKAIECSRSEVEVHASKLR